MNTMCKFLVAFVLALCASAICFAQKPVTNPEQTRTVFKSDDDDSEWETTEVLTLTDGKWQYNEVSRVAVNAIHENKMEVVAEKPEKVEPAEAPVVTNSANSVQVVESTFDSSKHVNAIMATKPNSVQDETPTMVQDNTPTNKPVVSSPIIRVGDSSSISVMPQPKPANKPSKVIASTSKDYSNLIGAMEELRAYLEVTSTVIFYNNKDAQKLIEQQNRIEAQQDQIQKSLNNLSKEVRSDRVSLVGVFISWILILIIGIIVGRISKRGDEPEWEYIEDPDDDGVPVVATKTDDEEDTIPPPTAEEESPTLDEPKNNVLEFSTYCDRLKELKANSPELEELEIVVMGDSEADAKELYYCLDTLLKSPAKNVTLYELETIVAGHERTTFESDNGKAVFFKVGTKAEQMRKRLNECQELRFEKAKNDAIRSKSQFRKSDIGSPGL